MTLVKSIGPNLEASDVEVPVNGVHIAQRLHNPICKQPLLGVRVYRGGGFLSTK
jgi:hypothetical protein